LCLGRNTIPSIRLTWRMRYAFAAGRLIGQTLRTLAFSKTNVNNLCSSTETEK